MNIPPKGMRLHIGLFGRRNVGKSSLLNALTRQHVSIVSDVAGTTTDPVEKPMELLPIGPVQFIDTAGIDDAGTLGEMRVQRTRQVFDRTDLGILVTAAGEWGAFEDAVLDELKLRKIPVIVVLNKHDLSCEGQAVPEALIDADIACVQVSCVTGQGLAELRHALVQSAPDEFINTPSIVGDLVPPGELAVLVVPIDKEAPKGRLILPQVQTIRDLLDHDACCVVVKEHGLREALNRLKTPPALVVTDSQAFQQVSADTPDSIPMTSFSILFARFKGDLAEFARGARAIGRLKSGDRVMVCEACTHHPIEDDIGRVKIPAWLNRSVGGELVFTHLQGHDFPADLGDYKLVIHCGSCMHNRREVLSKIIRCRQAGVPVTNYGIAIAYSLGICERALRPFPDALQAFEAGTGDLGAGAVSVDR